MAASYGVYRKLPGIILGFHGCDRKVGEEILKGTHKHLGQSNNLYDWLGTGVYFWENDPRRAMEFAREAMKRPIISKGKVTEPFVIGAVIDLGLCMNLLDRTVLSEVGRAYKLLKSAYVVTGDPMPQNKGGEDRSARYLDRAVLESVHATRKRLSRKWPNKYRAYDTVRGAFWEAGELYPTSGFSKKNHMQVAVRNLSCIKGYFRPIDGLVS